MTISMYSASVPVFRNMLGNLSHFLDKAQAHAEAKKFDPQAVFDIATLTGAALFILGYSGAPILGNNIELVNSKNFPWTKGRILIPISVSPSNKLVITRKGLWGSSVTVTLNAETQVPNILPISVLRLHPDT